MVEGILPPALLGVGFAYQLWRLRREPDNPVLRWLAVMFGVLVVAVGIGSAGPYLAFDRLVGIPNAARYVQHVSAMTGFCAVQIVLLYVARPPERARSGVRPRMATLAVVGATMLVLFALAPVDREAPGDFVDQYGGESLVALYLLLYLGYLGIGVVDVVVSCFRYANRSGDRPWLQASFRTLVLAGLVGLAYVLSKATFTILAWHGTQPAGPLTENVLSRLFIGTGAVLAAAGVLLPTVGARIDAGRRWLRQRRLHRDVMPLWRAICAAVPDVVLPSGGDVHWSLYRRQVEIQDGLLDLRFYRHPLAAEHARRLATDANLTGEDLRAVVEAADIAAALQVKRSGTPPVAADDPPALTAGADDLPAWLARLSTTFAHSPLVTATLTAVAPTTAEPSS